MRTKPEVVPASDITQLIRLVCGQRVILDRDLAGLYGVPTKVLNQAVKRNTGRFPVDFMFHLTAEETLAVSRSRSQFVTLKRGHNIKYLPRAFTEHGALMAANVLNSPRAVAMRVYVIRAFVRMREELAANAVVMKRLAEIDKKLFIHDSALREILQKMRPLQAPPPLPPKPEIGFHVKEDAVPYRATRRPRVAVDQVTVQNECAR